MFLTLCGRTLGYDCDRFHLSTSPVINVAHRAKKLDEVALGFVARHPDAVAVDLGAGLDTRVFRIAPHRPSTGTTSTSPRSSPPDANCCQPAPTPTPSAPT